MSLDEYLTSNGVLRVEGSVTVCPEQVQLLKELVDSDKIHSVLEIGFNAGHSAELFLKTNLTCSVLSFDYGAHDVVNIGKKYMDLTYPNRHSLVLGDSTVTVPCRESDKKYDMIFIDGGHDYAIAKADLLNCKRFAHKDTIVVMDDTNYVKGWERVWSTGPTKAWMEGMDMGLIHNSRMAEWRPGHGMSWANYKF